MNNLRNFDRNEIETLLLSTDINNVIYNIFNYNDSVNFDILTINDGVYECVRVDQTNLSLYRNFNLIYKIH